MFSYIETRLLSRLVQEYLTDQEYGQLQDELIKSPEAGAVFRGSGGVRKLRWSAAGRGKRGGYRIIYFVRRPKGVIWMLTIYPKGVTDMIPAHVLKQIREEIESE
jgi:mRNA-degrading endonuclease RelE of RelBE toxin-antitoxin system